MLVQPSRRSRLMAVLRRVAMIRGVWLGHAHADRKNGGAQRPGAEAPGERCSQVAAGEA